MDPEQIHVAKKLTQHYPVMWRDYLMLNLAGRFGVLQLEDGRQIHSLSEQQDVSDSLDAIGQAHGDILFRSSAGWRVLAPGAAGRALTTQGPGADPLWTPSAGAWSLVEAQTFVNATQHEWLGLEGGFEHQWVMADITTTGVNRSFHARVSLDGGATYETIGYRGMNRWQNDTGANGNETFTGSTQLIGGIGNNDDQSGAGVLQCVCDLARADTRKQWRGWSTQYVQDGTFFHSRFAGSLQASKAPIDAFLTFINGDEFSGQISLWRRPL